MDKEEAIKIINDAIEEHIKYYHGCIASPNIPEEHLPFMVPCEPPIVDLHPEAKETPK